MRHKGDQGFRYANRLVGQRLHRTKRARALPTPSTPDVLPDLLQDGHLFLFAKTPEQIAAKLAQLHEAPQGVTPHLILIDGGSQAQVHTAGSAAEALSVVVRVLTKA